MKLLKEIKNQEALVDKLEAHEKENLKLIAEYELVKKDQEEEEAIVIKSNCTTDIRSFSARKQRNLPTMMMGQILDYNQMDITFRLKQQKQLLAKMKADIPMRTIEFEKDSREANLNIDRLIEEAGKKERFKSASEGTMNAIQDIVTKYNLEKDGIEQDDKNDLYFELKRLINVAKKWK